MEIKTSFAYTLLKRLNKDRETREFCDGVVQVGERIFFVHRCVLCAASAQFERLFLENGDSSNNIMLTGMREEDVETVLDFLYTSILRVKKSNAMQLVTIADYLKLNEIRTACVKFLMLAIKKENSLNFRDFAIQNDVPELVEKAYEVQIQHLSYVITQQWFLNYTVLDLKALIEARKKTNLVSEEEVFKAALTWFTHDVSAREQYLDEVFFLINLEKISLYFLSVIAQTEAFSLKSHVSAVKAFLHIMMKENINCPLLNEETSCSSSQHEQSTATTSKTN